MKKKKKKRKKREEPLKLHKRGRDPIRGTTPAAEIIKVMLKYGMVLRVFNNMSGLGVICIQDYSIPWRDSFFVFQRISDIW